MKTFFAKAAVRGGLIFGLVAAFPSVPFMLPDAEMTAPQPVPVPLTVADRIDQFGAQARARLAPDFEAAGIPYPPRDVVLVGLKQERELQLYASGENGALHFIKAYPFAAWTGKLGPKLAEGDRQIPEGLYRLEYLNPNSIAHVSLKISYPNAFDRERGAEDGRTELGSDIMIHGRTGGSLGCVVLDDPDVEEIFTLANDIGLSRISVLLAPVDLRLKPAPEMKNAPGWIGHVYSDLTAAMTQLPSPRIQLAAE